MVVVATIAVLAVIAIPDFAKSRTAAQQEACISNLKQIDAAITQWVIEQRKSEASTYALTDTTLLAFLKGSVLPACAAGGTYTEGADVSILVTRNIEGHTLPGTPSPLPPAIQP
jgi:Tfp pilus assembly protein PilE